MCTVTPAVPMHFYSHSKINGYFVVNTLRAHVDRIAHAVVWIQSH